MSRLNRCCLRHTGRSSARHADSCMDCMALGMWLSGSARYSPEEVRASRSAADCAEAGAPVSASVIKERRVWSRTFVVLSIRSRTISARQLLPVIAVLVVLSCPGESLSDLTAHTLVQELNATNQFTHRMLIMFSTPLTRTRASLGIPRRCSPPLSRLHIRFGGRSSGASSTESLLNYDRASHWVPYCLPTPHCARHCPCNEYDALMNSDVLHPEP